MDADTFQNNLTGTPRQGYVQNRWWMTARRPDTEKEAIFLRRIRGLSRIDCQRLAHRCADSAP
jgi:hypothetical protein